MVMESWRLGRNRERFEEREREKKGRDREREMKLIVAIGGAMEVRLWRR